MQHPLLRTSNISRLTMFRTGLAALALMMPLAYAAPAKELPAAVDKAFTEYAALPGKLIPALSMAQDKASADAAAEKLRLALPAIYDARELLHHMPQLTPAQNEQVKQTYGHRMRVEWAKLYEQIARVREARCYQSVALAQAFRLMCMMIEK
jgi:hypothetical protein